MFRVGRIVYVGAGFGDYDIFALVHVYILSVEAYRGELVLRGNPPAVSVSDAADSRTLRLGALIHEVRRYYLLARVGSPAFVQVEKTEPRVVT